MNARCAERKVMPITGRPSFTKLLNITQDVTGIEPAQLFVRHRAHYLVCIRHALFIVANERGWTHNRIGKHFDFSASTITHLLKHRPARPLTQKIAEEIRRALDGHLPRLVDVNIPIHPGSLQRQVKSLKTATPRAIRGERVRVALPPMIQAHARYSGGGDRA